jgi:hypothetical protein
MTKITRQDLEFIEFTAINSWKSTSGLRLEGLDRKLTEREVVVISYVDAVFSLLVKKGILSLDTLPEVPLIAVDSDVAEADYA